MVASLAGLTDRYLDFVSEHHPIYATFLGLHANDETLGRFSKEAHAGRRETAGSLLTKLEALPPAGADTSELVDREVLRIALRGAVFSHDTLKSHERDPVHYIGAALSGCNQLLLRDFAPLGERARRFVARLREIPRVLAECIENVRNPPSAFALLAAGYARGGLSFLDATVPALSREVPSLSEELESASKAAGEAFEGAADHFASVGSESEVPFHVGREAYEWMLREIHLLELDSDELLELGSCAVSEISAEMDEAAARVDGSRSWRDLVEDLAKSHPTADELRDAYASEMAGAREFVERERLVTMPEGEELSVVDTPVFLRSLLPYAAYGPPGPFEERQQGIFYVTPVDAEASAAEQEGQLRGHPTHGIRVIALHEAYPGHHLQLVRANLNRGKTRKLARSNVFIEGWALYCEEMMREQGFLRGASMRLMQLKAALWRAARVVVDVRLQRGEMSLREAADFMVSEASLTPDKAAAEVRRYAMNPTQPSSYMLGKLAIRDIRTRYEGRAGRSFDLRTFHDELLDLGSVPPRLAEAALGLAEIGPGTSGPSRGREA